MKWEPPRGLMRGANLCPGEIWKKAGQILTTTPRGDKKILSCRETLDFLSKAPYITCSGSTSALVQGGAS